MLQQLYNRLPWVIRPPFRWVYYRYQNRRFNQLKEQANGMLSPEVYNKLYQYASNVSHSNVLEIGAAHGASTIALALGLEESQYDNRVITFEKGEGGSRAGTDRKKKI